MAFNFSGKKVLVTGAGRGIGRGITLALANAGCEVYALDCVKGNLDKLASEHSSIVTIFQDLSDCDTTRKILEDIEVLDGLVNNAGVLKGADPALDVSKEDIDGVLAVNLIAGINCIQVVAKKMIETGKSGSIVNISSSGSQKAFPNLLAYTVSKAGIDMATKQFALELGAHNIRVNSVNPTAVETDILTPEEKKAVFKEVVERMPMAKPATVEDIVGPVLYLLSDYSSMVTGTTHHVDGGVFCNITTKS